MSAQNHMRKRFQLVARRLLCYQCMCKISDLYIDILRHISMPWSVTGKATALSEADSASKAASGQSDPAEEADTMPDQAIADRQQEDDEWKLDPTTEWKAATRRGTKNSPAKRDRGGRKRQAVESDSQDSAEEEDKQQPASNCAYGLRSRQRRKQLVIEDENLQEDPGLGDGETDPVLRHHSGGAAEADVTPATLPESAVLSQANMEGYRHFNAGPRSISCQARTAPPDSISNANQDTGVTDTHEAAHVAQPRDGHAHQEPSNFSLLDAMLQPDASDGYTAPDRVKTSEFRSHAEHLSADDPDLQTSIDAGQANRKVSSSGQLQEALVSDAPPLSGQDVPPSRPSVKGSLRDRVRAFAALRN